MCIGSKNGLRYYNAILGMGRGTFMFLPLEGNSLAKTGA